MRVWLGATFAAVGLITAGYVYLFGGLLERERARRAFARARAGADDHAGGPGQRRPSVLPTWSSGSRAEGFYAWYFGADGRLIAPRRGGPVLRGIQRRGALVEESLTGRRVSKAFPERPRSSPFPVYGPAGIKGVVLGRFEAEGRSASRSTRSAGQPAGACHRRCHRDPCRLSGCDRDRASGEVGWPAAQTTWRGAA